MAAVATNIIAGPARLFTAAFGSAETSVIDAAVATEPADPWEDRGGTDDGITLSVETEWFAKRLDQTLLTPGQIPTNRTVTIATNLVEGTMENLKIALNQSVEDITSGGTGGTAYRATDLLGAEEPGEEMTYLALLLRGKGPAGKWRNFLVRKVLSVETIESAYKKDDQWLIPVTFAAHWVSPSIAAVRMVDENTA